MSGGVYPQGSRPGTQNVAVPTPLQVDGGVTQAVPVATIPDRPSNLFVAAPGPGQTSIIQLPPAPLTNQVEWVIPSPDADPTGTITIDANGNDIDTGTGALVGTTNLTVTAEERITQVRYNGTVWERVDMSAPELAVAFVPLEGVYRVEHASKLQAPLQPLAQRARLASGAPIQIIVVDATLAAQAVDLPVSPVDGQIVYIKAAPGSEFAIAVTDTNGNAIEGAGGSTLYFPTVAGDVATGLVLVYDPQSSPEWKILAWVGASVGNSYVATERGYAMGSGDTAGGDATFIGTQTTGWRSNGWSENNAAGNVAYQAWQPEYNPPDGAGDEPGLATYEVRVIARRKDAQGFVAATVTWCCEIVAGVYTLLLDDDADAFKVRYWRGAEGNSGLPTIAVDLLATGNRPRVTFDPDEAAPANWRLDAYGTVTFSVVAL